MGWGRSSRLVFLIAAVFGIFAMIAFGVPDYAFATGLVGVAARMEFAFTWTLRACGALVALVAAVHLLRFAGQRDQVDLIVPSSVALLGGLSLLGQHWSVVIVFGVLVIAFIGQQLLLRRAQVPADHAGPVAATSPPILSEGVTTGMQVNRG